MKPKVYRKQAKKGNPLLVAEMLREYEDNHGDFFKTKLWRIGYLCAMRDAGLLTWNQWIDRVAAVRQEADNDQR